MFSVILEPSVSVLAYLVLVIIDTDWPIFTYFIWQNSNVIFDALVHAVK